MTMRAPTSPSAITPTPAEERDPTLDVLRGFAVLGILLVNIELFRGGYYQRLAGDAYPMGWLDQAVTMGTLWLADGKFISPLAFLFGMGTGMQAVRATARGRRPMGMLARRYAILLLLGLGHLIFLWHGDVLTMCALVAFLLLPFTRVRARTAILSGLGLLLVATALVTLSSPPADPSDGARWLAAQAEAESAYNHGGVADQVGQRLLDADRLTGNSRHIGVIVPAMMLLGLGAARAGLSERIAEQRPVLVRFAVAGLVVGLPLNAVIVLDGMVESGA